MSRVVRKPAFCICENKDADQLRGNGNFKPLAIFCGCTARFVSELVRNPEDRFSHNGSSIGSVIASMTSQNGGQDGRHGSKMAAMTSRSRWV